MDGGNPHARDDGYDRDDELDRDDWLEFRRRLRSALAIQAAEERMTAAGIEHPSATRNRRQLARDRRSPPPTPRLHVEAQWPEVRRPWPPANRTRPRPAPRDHPTRPLNPTAQVRTNYVSPTLQTARRGMPPPMPRPPPARPLDPTVPSFVPDPSFAFPGEFGLPIEPDAGGPWSINPIGPDTEWDPISPEPVRRRWGPQRERNVRMWAQFQFEMLRVQTGMATGLSRPVLRWVDEVVENWIDRRHRERRRRSRTRE